MGAGEFISYLKLRVTGVVKKHILTVRKNAKIFHGGED